MKKSDRPKRGTMTHWQLLDSWKRIDAPKIITDSDKIPYGEWFSPVTEHPTELQEFNGVRGRLLGFIGETTGARLHPDLGDALEDWP